ncbi:MAG: acyl-CoA dehydrogenase family protein, partial [Flavobacteriaceae bacterium]
MALPQETAGAETSLHESIGEAHAAAARLLAKARAEVAKTVSRDGRIDAARLDAGQRSAHGLAWLATYVEAVGQLGAYAGRMEGEGRFGETERLLVLIGAGEYLDQIASGIAMNQGEVVRPADLGLSRADIDAFLDGAPSALIARGNTAGNRARLVALMRDWHGGPVGDTGLDETLEAMREEMRRFADSEIVPHAHQWHLDNAYVPMEVIRQVAEMGVFGLTVPEEFGGLGLGKESMCVVSEELSRGWIAVGS